MKGFNEFIERTKLLDVPIVGRKYTWYKANGTTKKRIDRVLVSFRSLEKWSEFK